MTMDDTDPAGLISSQSCYTVEEVAATLRVPIAQVRSLYRSGDLPSWRLGKRVYISGRAVLDLLDSIATSTDSADRRRAG